MEVYAAWIQTQMQYSFKSLWRYIIILKIVNSVFYIVVSVVIVFFAKFEQRRKLTFTIGMEYWTNPIFGKQIVLSRINSNISKYREFGDWKGWFWTQGITWYTIITPLFLLLFVCTNEKTVKLKPINFTFTISPA